MKKSLKRRALVAGAVTGGLAGTGHSATVQITLTGNQITALGGNQLNADVTGDTLSDITIANAYFRGNTEEQFKQVLASINGGRVSSFYTKSNNGADAVFALGGVSASQDYMNPITFTDARINGGAMTNGYLGVRVVPRSGVRLTRVVFDDASTARPTLIPGSNTVYPTFVPVPEASSLGLLALGAGGLMLRRERRKQA